MNKKNVILGTGPLGVWVAKLLTEQEQKVTLINRSGVMPCEIKGATIKAANLNDSRQVYNLCNDSDYVYHCAIPPYSQWHEKFNALTQGILKGLENCTAKLIYGDNLYMYGNTNGKPITENLECRAQGKKGKARAKAANDFLNSNIQIAIVRGSDFYGPYVKNSIFGIDFFRRALSGDTVNLLGNIDMPHTLTYIQDFARSMIKIAEIKSISNQVWHVQNAPTITIREWLNIIESEIGRPLKLRVANQMMVSFLGLFNPLIRETKEIMYQWDKAFIVKHHKYEKKFNKEYTLHKDAIQETICWVKTQEAA